MDNFTFQPKINPEKSGKDQSQDKGKKGRYSSWGIIKGNRDDHSTCWYFFGCLKNF